MTRASDNGSPPTVESRQPMGVVKIKKIKNITRRNRDLKREKNTRFSAPVNSHGIRRCVTSYRSDRRQIEKNDEQTRQKIVFEIAQDTDKAL